jgi:hypothetical protein
MHDVHAKVEELEGTVEAAQKALGKAERVLTVADEVHERSRHLVARVLLVFGIGAMVVAGLALLRRRSP